MRKTFFSAFLFFIFSCWNPSNFFDYGELFQKIIKTDEGIFRGFSLKDDYKKIQTSENGLLLEQDSLYLFYEYKLDFSDTYTIEYQFENEKLSDIRLDVYVQDKEQWKVLFENFREYYNSKFGNCIKEKGSFVWKVDSGGITIFLTDESTDYEEGILSLEFFYTPFSS